MVKSFLPNLVLNRTKGGYGVCNGDSGGPLMCIEDDIYYIAGIVSWSRGCAEKNAADVLTNVEQYLGWISKTIKDTFKVELNPQSNNKRPLTKFTCSDRRRAAYANSGIIQSQGWPRDYKPNLDCEVHIKRQTDTKAIKIWPQYFALPTDSSRSKLVLYGGKVAKDRILAIYYGAGGFDDHAFNTPFVHSGKGDLIIKFKSGPNRQWLNWGGFKLRYELLTSTDNGTELAQEAQTCGGELTGTSLHYEWPASNEKCLWTLPAPEKNEKYIVELVNFDLDPTVGGLFMWHNSMTPSNHIDNIQKGLKFDALGAVRIEFEGYEKTRRGQFTIVWEIKSTVEAVDLSKIKGSCKGDLNEPIGYFASPNYPSNYPDNAQCSWTIEAKDDEVIKFELINFDLERDYDYLKVESRPTGLTSFLDVQHEIYGYENQGSAIVSFRSDEMTNFGGFLIKYEITTPDQIDATEQPTIIHTDYEYDLPEETLSNIGSSDKRPSVVASEKCKFTTAVNHHDQLVIRSPGYPNKYPTNIECTWELELADKSKMMEIKFMNFKVEHISNCTYDRLDINDGGNISRLCGELGKQVQYVYDVYSSHAQLKFVSDLVKNDFGFELEINVIPRPPTTQPPASVVYQCDFDFGECGFNSGEERTFRWIRHRDNTPSEDTGPQADAGKSGHYMYFEASDRSEGDIGRLYTGKQTYRGDANNEQLDLDPHCLQFKFDMFGKDMGSMNLYLIQDGKKSLVWKQIGASRFAKDDPAWKQVSLTFYPYSSYEFVFEAISGSAYRSDMALDDVIISQNMCVSCIGDGLFDCQSDNNDNECILAEFKCDGVNDCSNGKDEHECMSPGHLSTFIDTCIENNWQNLPSCQPEKITKTCSNVTESNVICNGKWDCAYGYDEAGCTESLSSTDSCGLPAPEPRAALGWAKGRAKFEQQDHRWLWTGALFYKNKFQCSVHMVKANWYLTSMDCVEKGIVKEKIKEQWFDHRGCAIKQASKSEEKSIDSNNYSIHHVNINDTNQMVKFDIETILIQPDEVKGGKKSTMVLINTKPNINDIRQSICLNSPVERRFNFDLDRPQLCQVVGHRYDKHSNVHKWQSLVPVRSDELTNDYNEEYSVIQAGYQMLLISPFGDDPGAGLFCQGWNQQWHLVGILRDLPTETANRWPLARAGQTTFTPVAQLSNWVQRSCPGQFVCERSRRCIDLKLVCDGKLDCDDNSDEMNCKSGCADTPTWLSVNGV